MKFTRSAGILLSASFLFNMILPEAALAGSNRHNPPRARTRGDQYTFSYSDLKCKDSNGNEGYNSSTFTPCTDFTHMTLNKGKNKNQLQRKGRNLYGSTFEGSNLSGLYFDSANLSFVNFEDAFLGNVSFDRTSLAGANFKGANLSNVEFLGATHWKARYRKTPYQLDGATFDSRTKPRHKSFREFAYSKNMIREEASKEEKGVIEVEGATMQVDGDLKWEDDTLEVPVKLDGYVYEWTLTIQQEKILEQAKALNNTKVKVGIKDGTLVFVEPMETF